MTQKKSATFTRSQRVLLSLLGALPLPLSLLVSGPLDLFVGNAAEFGFSLSDFYPLLLLLGLAFAALLFLLLFLLPEGCFRVVFPILCALSLSFSVLPLVNRVSGLPGDRLSTPSVGQSVWGVLIPLALICAGVIVFQVVKSGSRLSVISEIVLIPLLFSILASLGSLLLSHREALEKQDTSTKTGGVLTTDNITTVCREANVLYFCIDRLDEAFLRVAEELDPDLFSEFDGFTRYTDHLSLYSNTYPAVLYMLTQNEADFSAIRSVNFRDGYGNARLLSTLSDAGYRIGIYADGYYCFGTLENVRPYAENLLSEGHYSVTEKKALSFEMAALSLYRSTPSIFSGLFSALSSDTFSDHLTYISEDHSDIAYNSGNRNVKDETLRRGAKVEGGKRFSYIHIEGMHDILEADEDPQATLDRLRECFALVGLYLDALRDAGLYENATVVVTGDHPSPIDDYHGVGEPRVTALLVKRRGDAGTPIQTSDAQVDQGQIYSEILDSEGFSLSESDTLPLSRTPLGENRVRYHHFVCKTGAGFKLERWKVTGPAWDFANWELESDDLYKKSLYD